MIQIIVGAICFAYGIFCIVKGGTHVKNVGWRTKEEYPKSFYFTVILMIKLFVENSLWVNVCMHVCVWERGHKLSSCLTQLDISLILSSYKLLCCAAQIIVFGNYRKSRV